MYCLKFGQKIGIVVNLLLTFNNNSNSNSNSNETFLTNLNSISNSTKICNDCIDVVREYNPRDSNLHIKRIMLKIIMLITRRIHKFIVSSNKFIFIYPINKKCIVKRDKNVLDDKYQNVTTNFSTNPLIHESTLTVNVIILLQHCFGHALNFPHVA